MVKPATVEQESIDREALSKKQRLRVVEGGVLKPSATNSRSVENPRPDIADDLDDMWDNVPV